MNECIICYNKLNLICECKYIVHNECYEKWYIKKPSCIICHNYAFPPTKLGRRKKEKYINNKTSVFAIFVYTIIIIYILLFKK